MIIHRGPICALVATALLFGILCFSIPALSPHPPPQRDNVQFSLVAVAEDALSRQHEVYDLYVIR